MNLTNPFLKTILVSGHHHIFGQLIPQIVPYVKTFLLLSILNFHQLFSLNEFQYSERRQNIHSLHKAKGLYAQSYACPITINEAYFQESVGRVAASTMSLSFSKETNLTRFDRVLENSVTLHSLPKIIVPSIPWWNAVINNRPVSICNYMVHRALHDKTSKF